MRLPLFIQEEYMLYDKNGYLDVDQIMKSDSTVFKFIVGGRGTGKTFGILKYMVDKARQTGMKFIYLRRTQTQVDLLKSEELNPFLALENELGPSYRLVINKINKSMSGLYECEYDNKTGTFHAKGNPISYIMALSTVANLRGMSAADVTDIFYDEFSPEKHEKPIKNEGRAFLNMVETFGRNRELAGREPLKVICASNSEDLANPLFLTLNFITPCEKALRSQKDIVRIPSRNATIYLLHNSPISQMKKQTSLYQLAGEDSEFSHMSLDNEFTADQMDMVKVRPLKEFKPLVRVGEICIYKHKDKKEWYVTHHMSGDPIRFDSSELDLKRFADRFYYMKLAHLNRHIFFETYLDQVLMEKYLNM